MLMADAATGQGFTDNRHTPSLAEGNGSSARLLLSVHAAFASLSWFRLLLRGLRLTGGHGFGPFASYQVGIRTPTRSHLGLC